MKFEVLNGPEDGKVVEVNKERITFGRLYDRDISLPYGKKVTRFHGEIYKKGDAVFAADTGKDGKGSLHGITVKREGENINIKGKEAEIRPGDILVIGKCIWLRFLG